MRIGALARATDVPIDTIRYYERVGLLPQAPRQRSGYRIYGPEAIARLSVIRDARHLGFSLQVIRELLALLEPATATDAAARRLAQRRLAEIDARVAELGALRDRLRRALEGEAAAASTSAAVLVPAPGRARP